MGNFSIIEKDGKVKIVFSDNVKLTPGPNYMVYLVPKASIETESEFFEYKDESLSLGSIKSFTGIQSYNIPSNVDYKDYESIIVWCERFSEL